MQHSPIESNRMAQVFAEDSRLGVHAKGVGTGAEAAVVAAAAARTRRRKKSLRKVKGSPSSLL